MVGALMGRSYTPRYAVHTYVRGFQITPSAWRVRSRGQIPGDGQPTDENLARYVKSFEESSRTGVNKHLGGMIVTKAMIVDQQTDITVAQYRAHHS